MKVFLCIIVLIMPDGTANIKSSLVETCPDQATVQGYFNARKQAKQIQDWYGMCILTPLEKAEMT